MAFLIRCTGQTSTRERSLNEDNGTQRTEKINTQVAAVPRARLKTEARCTLKHFPLRENRKNDDGRRSTNFAQAFPVEMKNVFVTRF